MIVLVIFLHLFSSSGVSVKTSSKLEVDVRRCRFDFRAEAVPQDAIFAPIEKTRLNFDVRDDYHLF